MISRALRAIPAALLATLLTVGVISAPAAADDRDCRDETVRPTVEEARLTRTLGHSTVPVAERILRSVGMDRLVRQFEAALCAAPSRHVAAAMIHAFGHRAWTTAVRQAGDDRPLYWARLSMTLALRQWTPRSPLSPADRAALEKRLEYVSRGITSTDFQPRPGVTRLLVSGFDPFLLDTEIRRGNPSGAAILRLDGRVIDAGGSRVEIQAVVFPVRYADFDAGVVEDAFRPHLLPGRQQAHMFSTVSQGRPGAFDLEVWNGRRRSVISIGDNNNIWGGGSPTAPVVFPGVGPGPEFVQATLPHDAMLQATGRPFLVRRNPSVVEIPAGQTAPVPRPDGPTVGSIAVQGSGGGYLSNESAYRTTLLRDLLNARLPGGHVHTPVLVMDPANTTEITDPIFERNRTDIALQVETILRLGAATLR